MDWVDVCGPPGVGKSTLCDPLWGPHDIPILNTLPPVEWTDFLNEITRLFTVIQKHPSLVAAVRMNRRSVRKMAEVNMTNPHLDLTEDNKWIRHDPERVYVQTGFVQRALGFGWRMADMGIDVRELAHFFRLMPVSIGVAFLECDEETVKERNKGREQVKETAHENRSFMVPLMQPAIELAKEIFDARGVPFITIHTGGNIADARKHLVDFARSEPRNTPPLRFGGEVQFLSAPPVWW